MLEILSSTIRQEKYIKKLQMWMEVRSQIILIFR
jgi:hypothetical protein